MAGRTGRSLGSRVVRATALERRAASVPAVMPLERRTADAVPAATRDAPRATVVEIPARAPHAPPAGSSAAAGGPPAALAHERSAASADAESIRRDLASSWGEVGSTWGFPPATARVHGYLLAHRRPLAEREIRLAVGLSHRAASLALAEAVAWGLVERVPEPRRAGSRGPAGAAWMAIGDHWRWFGRVVEERRLREGDPAVAALERASSAARVAADGRPDDPELADLRDWLDDFLAFVRLFDRMAALVARVPPRDLERAMRARRAGARRHGAADARPARSAAGRRRPAAPGRIGPTASLRRVTGRAALRRRASSAGGMRQVPGSARGACLLSRPRERPAARPETAPARARRRSSRASAGP